MVLSYEVDKKKQLIGLFAHPLFTADDCKDKLRNAGGLGELFKHPYKLAYILYNDIRNKLL